MPAGRPPKPTALKVLEGNRGHDPKLKEKVALELSANHEIPTCPEWLDDDAKAKWPEVIEELQHMNLITHADGDILATYCQTWSDFKHATEVLRDEGTVLKTPKGDVARPEVAISRNSKMLLRQLAQEFGFTPSARGRMVVPQSKKEQDDLDSMLGL